MFKFEISFQNLKEMLTSAPVLKIVNPDENIMVCTDACQRGISGVLTRNATHVLKLEAVVHALKIWRHYLMGKKFELRTDRRGLKYLFEQPNLNARKIIWMELLCKYDFDIKHIQGKENKVADALSRRMHMMHVAISIITSYLKDRIKESNNTGESFQ